MILLFFFCTSGHVYFSYIYSKLWFLPDLRIGHKCPAAHKHLAADLASLAALKSSLKNDSDSDGRKL